MPNRRRSRSLQPNRGSGPCSGVLAIAVISCGVAYYLNALGYESTDDAFIDGHVVPISSRVAGHVAKVYVRTTNGSSRAICWSSWTRAISRRGWPRPRRRLKRPGPGRPRRFGADVTKITSSAGVDEASAGIEGAKAVVRPRRAAVATAKSQQAEAQAQLAAAQAALQQAQAELLAAEARQQRRLPT